MEELGTLKEDEVLRRLCSDEAAGLTEKETLCRRPAYGPNIVVPHPPQVYNKKFRILMSTALHLGWDYPFRKYKSVAGMESWDYGFPENDFALLDILLNFVLWVALIVKAVLLIIPSVRQESYELAAAVIPLFVTFLVTCSVAKYIANHGAKVSVEAKAYALRAKVLRDGTWRDEHAENLVPGDIIFLKCGDIVPADARVLGGVHVTTSTRWAERFTPGCVYSRLVYYAWTVSRGQGTAVVVATGRGIPRRKNSPQFYPECFSRPGQLRNGIAVAGTFCVSLILVGTVAEFIVFFSQGHKHKDDLLPSYFFMPLICGIPMAMPAFLYLALALGSLRLSSLGMAIRGTVALEDLASVDVMLFYLTGTLTCNKPRFDRGKIEVLADGVDKDGALLLAARASRAHHELYKDPVDEAILNLLDDLK